MSGIYLYNYNTYKRTCLICKREFKLYSPNKKTCSPDCKDTQTKRNARAIFDRKKAESLRLEAEQGKT